MKATVIVCTYNRCDTLAKTLESLAASTIPDSVEWEIVVIDNNSSDRTRQVVEDFSRRFPGRFRYAFEPLQGKSFALNRGIRETQADVLAFTDDDVTVEPGWLCNLTQNLFSGEWAGAGGRTLPTAASSLPNWFELDGPQTLAGAVCGGLDLGDEPCDMQRPPYGANMAYRREVFEIGSFRTDIGPGITNPRARVGEDVNIGYGVLARGGKLRYEPNAVVRHPLDPRRISKQYILPFAFEVGRYQAIETERKSPVYGIPRKYWTLGRLIGVEFPTRLFRWLSTSEPAKRFVNRYLLSVTLGQAYELAFGPRRSHETAGPHVNHYSQGTDTR